MSDCPKDCPHYEHDGETQDVCFAEDGECPKQQDEDE